MLYNVVVGFSVRRKPANQPPLSSLRRLTITQLIKAPDRETGKVLLIMVEQNASKLYGLFRSAFDSSQYSADDQTYHDLALPYQLDRVWKRALSASCIPSTLLPLLRRSILAVAISKLQPRAADPA